MSGMPGASDQLLISRVRQGEPEAWEELIAQYEGRLLAFVNSRLGNRATSEDVVQETFLGFLTSLPNYDERRSPLESFLFAIAAHKLTDVLRRQGRRPTIPLAPATDSSSGWDPPGTARGASSLLRSREGRSDQSDLIAATLEGLIREWIGSGQFERLKCLEMLLVLGWRNKSVAEHLKISEQDVANHKFFVVRKLKEAAERSQLGTIDLTDFGLDDDPATTD